MIYIYTPTFGWIEVNIPDIDPMGWREIFKDFLVVKVGGTLLQEDLQVSNNPFLTGVGKDRSQPTNWYTSN